MPDVTLFPRLKGVMSDVTEFLHGMCAELFRSSDVAQRWPSYMTSSGKRMRSWTPHYLSICEAATNTRRSL